MSSLSPAATGLFSFRVPCVSLAPLRGRGGVPVWGLGSTTFRRQEQQGGTEPDESYCLGEEKTFPDLAIEIVLTSGSLDKLEVYRRLGVQEVWFWQNQQFEVYHLHGTRYEKRAKSALLPNLDLAVLAAYAAKSDPLEALLEYRQRLRQDV